MTHALEEYDFHPVCLAFPAMDAEAFRSLRTDYAIHPERAGESVVVLAPDDGELKVLDGRYHYRICLELGYPVEYGRLDGNAVDIVSDALRRLKNSHAFTQTQREAVWLGIMDWYESRKKLIVRL